MTYPAASGWVGLVWLGQKARRGIHPPFLSIPDIAAARPRFGLASSRRSRSASKLLRPRDTGREPTVLLRRHVTCMGWTCRIRAGKRIAHARFETLKKPGHV